jgi:hypothetical protein
VINGAHAILYSDDADATRAALARVLGTRSVDAGGGWLIFALPPAEIAVHPADEGGRAELYLMTDDLAATVEALQAEGIEVARPISDQGWSLRPLPAPPSNCDAAELSLPQQTRPARATYAVGTVQDKPSPTSLPQQIGHLLRLVTSGPSLPDPFYPVTMRRGA